ncbi:MAG TPA: pyridoxamine 5'-phosphate oxidase family protein [Frankiaceae bacterium]|nr:pyridoxamine 5'-phosphate oxidase family protein [Frankiaceae bacterium]
MSRIGRDRVPWHLVESLAAGRSALANASRATADIARAVAERKELGDGLNRFSGTSGTNQLVAMTRDECLRLLAARCIGRLAFIHRAGLPLILPVNYVLAKDAVLILSGPGPKMQAAERGELVSFEVDDIDEDTHVGWSVVVTGRFARERGELRPCEPRPQPWAPGPRTHLLRIPLSRVTGRWLFADENEHGA